MRRGLGEGVDEDLGDEGCEGQLRGEGGCDAGLRGGRRTSGGSEKMAGSWSVDMLEVLCEGASRGEQSRKPAGGRKSERRATS